MSTLKIPAQVPVAEHPRGDWGRGAWCAILRLIRGQAQLMEGTSTLSYYGRFSINPNKSNIHRWEEFIGPLPASQPSRAELASLASCGRFLPRIILVRGFLPRPWPIAGGPTVVFIQLIVLYGLWFCTSILHYSPSVGVPVGHASGVVSMLWLIFSCSSSEEL